MKVIVQWILTLILPLLLVLTGLRLILNPIYLQIEYNRPNFPADPYGFTTAERLKFGSASLDYLMSGQSRDELAQVKLNSGDALYNDRELSHMVDVQVLIQFWLKVWLILAVTFIVLLLFGSNPDWRQAVLAGLRNGGWLTLGLLLAILASVLIDFYGFFTLFHKLFFEGDTWLFYDSDSLIRLFPLPFWRDGFLVVGGFTILGAITAILIGNRRLTKKD
ncbi:MAG TPA: TIGR01906 family membrane protein [Bellilinea sp.]|nr:TIGR01906 family membrane protein [Bellilinea sp.]